MTDRITRPRQERFRRDAEFVVVRPVRLSAKEMLQPGDGLPEGLRRGHVRSLYLRRRIGIKGSAWADYMLGTFAGLASQDAAEAVSEKRLAESAAEKDAEKARAAELAAAATGPGEGTPGEGDVLIDLEGDGENEGKGEGGDAELDDLVS